MEGRAHRVEAPHPRENVDEGRASRTQTTYEPQDGTSSAQPENLREDATKSDASGKEETIVFKSTNGDSYIWPFALCRTFDVSSRIFTPRL